jgi:PBSX family phage terminase large subunit
MKLTNAQAQIANDTHRFRVINIGRRGGKTTLAVEEIKGMAVYKEARIAYIAPTYQQARDIAWQMLIKELQPIILKQNESRLELEVRNLKETTSLIQLRGWESIETMRGQRFDLLILDEVAMMRNFWSNWEEVLRPTLTDTRGGAIFISTPKGFNHFYDLYNLENKDKDYKSFHFTTYDNPFMPIDEIDKAKNELPEDRFSQEYLADFRKTEGLVYKEFSRERHLFNDDRMAINSIDRIAGIDFGFTNPCAVLTIKVDYDSTYWITDEFYKTGQTDVMVAEYVASQKYNKVYPDPESPSAIEELRKRGVNIREVIKNKDSIRNGITQIRELLKANRLFIHSRCINLIEELESYSYPEKKDAHNEEEAPIKEHDHAVDALRYALSSQEDIRRVGKPTVYYPSQFKPKTPL